MNARMYGDEGRLDPTTHARVFADEVVPDSGLLEATSQARPKAIILAGQPGAGKGGMADTAQAELLDDAVTVDPDDLRKWVSTGASRARWMILVTAATFRRPYANTSTKPSLPASTRFKRKPTRRFASITAKATNSLTAAAMRARPVRR